MARYGIRPARAFGVSMGTMAPLAKRLGKDHALALALWDTGWNEARMLAALVDDPGRVTRRQMNAWVHDFDNWAVCDTACFHLFDRTPFAWEKVHSWSASEREYVRRAAFALIASLAAHDREAGDGSFEAFLPLIERAAEDKRNFVRKAVSWALRQVGKHNSSLHARALTLAERLSRSEDSSERWVGRDACRELRSPAVKRRLAARAARGTGTRGQGRRR